MEDRLGLNSGISMAHDALSEKFDAMEVVHLIDFMLKHWPGLAVGKGLDSIFALIVSTTKRVLCW